MLTLPPDLNVYITAALFVLGAYLFALYLGLIVWTVPRHSLPLARRARRDPGDPSGGPLHPARAARLHAIAAAHDPGRAT